MIAFALGLAIAASPSLRAEDKPEKPQRPNAGQGPDGAPGPGQRAEMMRARMEKLIQELGLSDEQKGKVREAMKEQAQAVQELRDLDPEARREKMKELRGSMEAKMKEILTAEQYAKWEKLREQLRPGGQGGPGGPGAPGNPNGNSDSKPGKTKRQKPSQN